MADVDDQRNLEICSIMSLGKAMANGFMTKKFVDGTEVDFNQNTITTLLGQIVLKKWWFYIRKKLKKWTLRFKSPFL